MAFRHSVMHFWQAINGLPIGSIKAPPTINTATGNKSFIVEIRKTIWHLNILSLYCVHFHAHTSDLKMLRMPLPIVVNHVQHLSVLHCSIVLWRLCRIYTYFVDQHACNTLTVANHWETDRKFWRNFDRILFYVGHTTGSVIPMISAILGFLVL